MDELKNTQQNNDRDNSAHRMETLDELLKWADSALDELEKPKEHALKKPIEADIAEAEKTAAEIFSSEKEAAYAPSHEEAAAKAEALDALLKWADSALDSFENFMDAQGANEEEPATENREAEETCREENDLDENTPSSDEQKDNGAEYDMTQAYFDDEDFDDLDPEDIDYNDDDLLKGYVWDEETGRLYRLKDKKRSNVLLPVFALLLAVITAAACLINRTPLVPVTKQDDGSILADEQQSPTQQEHAVVLPSEEQSPPEQSTEADTVYFIPAEIVYDGDSVAVMASTEAAHALLEDVLDHFDGLVTGDGEKQSRYEDTVEVVPLPNGMGMETDSYDEVFELFTSSASPVKVRTTLTQVETEVIPFETDTEDDSTLIEGTRIVASMGREGSETKRTYNVYINGDRSSSRSGSDTETVKPLDMLIYEGEEKLDPEEDSPGRHEGKKGPDEGDLEFAAPMDAKISCNFGQLFGVLHLGLDYTPDETDHVLASEAGTVVALLDRGSYGLMLEIDHGNGFVTRYAHLDSASVVVGDKVEKGQVVAKAGSSGNVEKKVLHFELRIDGIAYNPRYYLD